MSHDIDFHAAGSAWFGRASWTEEFVVGEFKVALYEAHPADTNSELGHFACVLTRGERLSGLLFARRRVPQLTGTVGFEQGSRVVSVEHFTGTIADFKVEVTRELNRGPGPVDRLVKLLP